MSVTHEEPWELFSTMRLSRMNKTIHAGECDLLSMSNQGMGLDGVGVSDSLNGETSERQGLACFAIWEEGRGKEEAIIDELSENFKLVANFLIYWTNDNYTRNIHRLYQRAGGNSEFKGYDKKIGRPPFRFLIVEDPNPSYALMRNVSGLIETSNKNVVRMKYEFRSWFEKEYQVHSSNNDSEFFFQATLVLGTEWLMEALADPCFVSKEIHKDLEGADGWTSWSELFSVLNTCSNYLVLRNFDSLPQEPGGGDVDFLCDDFQRLASLANVYQRQDRPYKGFARVAGAEIPIDIRFVGDGYYPCAWQKDMLARRKKHKGIYIPVLEDYFFSVLYHCKVHKREVDKKYRHVLADVANEMQWDWFSEVDVADDVQVGNLLKGYLQSRKYYHEYPVDAGVYRNDKFIEKIIGVPFFDVGEGRFIKLLREQKRIFNKIQKKINRQLGSSTR